LGVQEKLKEPGEILKHLRSHHRNRIEFKGDDFLSIPCLRPAKGWRAFLGLQEMGTREIEAGEQFSYEDILRDAHLKTAVLAHPQDFTKARKKMNPLIRHIAYDPNADCQIEIRSFSSWNELVSENEDLAHLEHVSGDIIWREE